MIKQLFGVHKDLIFVGVFFGGRGVLLFFSPRPLMLILLISSHFIEK